MLFSGLDKMLLILMDDLGDLMRFFNIFTERSNWFDYNYQIGKLFTRTVLSKK